MAKPDFNKKTITNGAYGASVTQERYINRSPIGFHREHEMGVATQDENQPMRSSTVGAQRTEADATILAAVKWYMEERTRKCFRDSLDREMMVKLDKIFIKYYETIV